MAGYAPTTALRKIANLSKRIRVIQGGTSAGKTIAILIYLIDIADRWELETGEGTSISVVSESMPHLRRGAERDFFNILRAHNMYKAGMHNRSDHTYNFGKSYVEFFSADDPSKLRGSRRDVLFINEANNVAFSAYEQLEVRTKKLVIIDFNPVSEFWAHTEVMPHVDHDFLKLTYKDNEALDPNIIASIESRKHNTNWWRVYGLGEIGIKEGVVYPDWKPIKRIPKEARLVGYGLDFGYSNHPTGIVSAWKWNNAYILHQEEYRVGMKNPVIAEKLNGLPKALVVGDSSEPKSIDEIRDHNINIIGATKGQGSVTWGIDLVQSLDIYYTESSLDLAHERLNYLWKIDKRTGKPLNVPEDIFNHLMDAARYILTELEGKPEPGLIQYLKGQAKETEDPDAQAQT